MKSFSLYEEYAELVGILNKKEQAYLWLSIINYMFYDKEPEGLNETQMKIFVNLKRPLDKSKKKSKNGTTTYTKQNQNKIKIKSKINQNNINNDNTSDVNVNVNNIYNNTNNLEEIGYGEEKPLQENLFDFIEKRFGRTLSPTEYEVISKWEDNDLTRFAVKQAELARAFNIRYIERILSSYKQNNITTVSQAEEELKKFKNKKNDTPSAFRTYEKEEMSEEELQEVEDMFREFR